MSARGARSRKVVQKQIEKKEKKEPNKGKQVESILRPHDAFSDWRSTPGLGNGRDDSLPSRTVTITSNTSYATSRSSSTHASGSRPRLHRIDSNESTNFSSLMHRPKTSASRRTSISEDSVTGSQKKKYQAKGKPTVAPRGRGGGVPVKKPVSQSPPPPLFRAESTMPQMSSNTKTWINFRIWEGGESGLRPYGGFDYDEHMQTGNVLIYFKEEQTSDDRAVPQIRCDFDVLQNSGSTWLKNALLYGEIDDNGDEWTLPGSPGSSKPPSSMSLANQAISPNFRHAPPLQDEAYFGVPNSRNFSRNDYSPPPPGGPFGQPQEIPTHELWFTAPAHVRTPQAQRLHHVAVRNFLALLHNKPIVGADLFEMLSTLQPEIQVMYDLDYDERERLTPRERSVQIITQYLSSHRLDDVRNSIKRALGLLAWAEQDNVRWRQGYLECFAHLAGIMTPQLEESPDFKRLSMGTRRNLALASKSLQLHVLETEEKLATFDFSDMWEDNPKITGNPIYQSYMAFRQFLISHYTRVYGSWPPNNGKRWLNRKIIRDLQEDFGSLYDYLVDRQVVWDSREERPGKKWKMEHQGSSMDFTADFPELSLTDMFVTFDSRHGFQHIPHPYPLLPREVPSVKSPTIKKGFFSSLKRPKNDVTKDAKAHLQLSIVFSDATNIERLDASFRGSALIDQFEAFELSADLKGVRPRDARLGRWVLLYGVLEVISRLSVDVHGLKWSEGVRYFLCADLKRCPEWVADGNVENIEASQLRSYCWQRNWSNKRTKSEPIELEGSSVPLGRELGGELDGATMLNNDIQRISEKIDELGRARAYERRIDNEKLKQEDMAKAKRDESFRLTESDFERPPHIPIRSHMRQAPAIQAYRPRQGYYPEDKHGWTLN